MCEGIIVIGTSAGGIEALSKILPSLPVDCKYAICIVQHISPSKPSYTVEIFSKICPIEISEAFDKEIILPGHVYIAPPNYHLLVNDDFSFSLETGERVNYSIPSIDVLFESVADLLSTKIIGILLTGANFDGSKGLKKIQDVGGYSIVQSPSSAEVPEMPNSALKIMQPDLIANLDEIATFFFNINKFVF